MSTAPQALHYVTAPFHSPSQTPRPTLILLHGRGTDENDLLGLAPYLPPDLFVVSVRAPFKFAYGGYTWFDLNESSLVNIDQLLDGCSLLLQSIADIQQKYPVDPKRFFLFGFSMGAMMSLTLSLLHPQMFNGVIAHSGLLPEDDRLQYRWKELGGVSYFIAHGEHDPIVPVEMGRHACRRLSDAHADVTYREYPIEHTISDESLDAANAWLRSRLHPPGESQ